MKKLTELKFEELTLDQKLGMVHTIKVNGGIIPEEVEFIFDRIKKRAVGAVWIQWGAWKWDIFLKRVLETADYPILIITDAEKGMEEFMIGHHNPIGCTGDEKYAYAFGKTVGYTAKKLGYNVVCNPILDMGNGFTRAYSNNKDVIAKMAAAEIKGMHEAGILAVGKHYPSARNDLDIDSHMAEGFSNQTKEELLETSLYSYLELAKQGLLDGVMTSHHKLPQIDDQYPASLSKKVIDIFREHGFEGFCITDALNMMGIRAKFGEAESIGLSIAAGNDLPLPFTHFSSREHAAIKAAYEKGVITDEQLDASVKRVLAAQHKVMMLDESRCTSLTEEEIRLSKNIARDSVYAKIDEGLTPAISRDGKHLFAIMVRNEMDVNSVDVNTFSSSWLFPKELSEKILELFPNSQVKFFHEYPTEKQNYDIFQGSLVNDDVIFLTFTEPLPYVGKESITSRVVSLMEALQYTNRVSALMHFGNPCVLEALPHIPRVLIGGIVKETVDATIDILAGEYEAKGVKTFDYELK